MQVCRLSSLYQHITHILLAHQNWTYVQLGFQVPKESKDPPGICLQNSAKILSDNQFSI